MAKLMFLLVACVFGNVLCETPEQLRKYAGELVNYIEKSAEELDGILRSANTNSEEGKNMILMHATGYNFDVHYALDCLQHVVNKNEEQPAALQQIVLKLNKITSDLEKSFKNGVRYVKTHLLESVNNVVVEAKNLQKIINRNGNQYYTTTLVRFLDDLAYASDAMIVRDGRRNLPRVYHKIYIETVTRNITYLLSYFNSEDTNVHNDIIRYSSKVTSTISKTGNLLKELTFMSKNKKSEEVKEIVYALSKMVEDNEEVLYNERSFQKIKQQFRLTLLSFAHQLGKIVDVAYSGDGMHDLEDADVLYIILPLNIAESRKLHRNFVRTLENYVGPELPISN